MDGMTPEQQARVNIDALLSAAGWHVCNMAQANIHAARGVALREFPLNTGYGFADYLLYIDGKAAGVIKAKKEGATLSGVEIQSARYAQGLPASLRGRLGIFWTGRSPICVAGPSACLRARTWLDDCDREGEVSGAAKQVKGAWLSRARPCSTTH